MNYSCLMLWGKYDSVILDLDGVVYIGDYAVAHAVESLQQLRKSVKISAATNNASRNSLVVAQHLTSLGLPIDEADVFTSAQAGAEMMADLVPANSRILAVGGAGVSQALEAVDLHPLRATQDHVANDTIAGEVAGVLQGHGVDTSWWDLSTAAWAITRGAQWVATNRDLTAPTPFGLGPGNGSLVAVLEIVVGSSPLVAGKPEPALFQKTLKHIGASNPLIIGDRLDTDVDGAIAAGFDSLLVLTGVHQLRDVVQRSAEEMPTYISQDLRCLLSEHPPVWPLN